MSPINTGSLLLPVTALAAVKNAVNIVHKITKKVNLGQIFVITEDQPVNAIEKQLQ